MRIGISVNSLGISHLAMVLTEQVNRIGELDKYVDAIIFYHRYDKLLKPPLFAMLQEEEMWGYDAPVVATTLETARTLLFCPKPTKKFFYVWDLEWMYGMFDVEDMAKVYCNPDLHLIARSESHAEIIEQCWKKPIDILEDFNNEELIRILTSH